VPLLVNILVFSGGIAGGVLWFDGFVASMQARVPSWLGWLDWVLWPLFVLLLLGVVFYGFSLIANLIAAPFNGLLAERVEQHLTGHPPSQEMDFKRMLRELLPTLWDEGKKIVYALLLGIPFVFLLFVPLVGPLLWFLYTAWILAFQYADYPMGNHGIKLKEMRQRLKDRQLLALGFGAATAGLGLVPVLNFIAMPSAVAGATALWVRELKGTTNYQGPHQSRVATRFVLLVVDHYSGHIGGEVLDGPQRGKPLEAVSTDDLVELLHRAYMHDASSAEALEVYLERERNRPIRRPSPQTFASQAPRAPTAASARMNESEALAVLGLPPSAGPAEIRAAHKRLMQRLHPDRGGSDYLASKINEAKDVLTE
jgi:CysZ protein